MGGIHNRFSGFSKPPMQNSFASSQVKFTTTTLFAAIAAQLTTQVQLAGDSPKMTRGCMTHATTTTPIAVAVVDGVSITDPRNSAMQYHYSRYLTTLSKSAQSPYIVKFQKKETNNKECDFLKFFLPYLEEQNPSFPSQGLYPFIYLHAY